MFRNCGFTFDSSKIDSCGVVLKHFFFGEAKLCSGTVAVLLLAANRTGVECWW